MELTGPLPRRFFRPPLDRRADTVPAVQPPGPSTEGAVLVLLGVVLVCMLRHRLRSILVLQMFPHIGNRKLRGRLVF